jgi:hypothetical protein
LGLSFGFQDSGDGRIEQIPLRATVQNAAAARQRRSLQLKLRWRLAAPKPTH